MKSGLNWLDVVFSDESMIELRPTRRILVRRPPNLGFHPLFTPKLKKVPAKKKDHLGMCQLEWLKVDDKHKVNADAYTDFLKNKVVPFRNLQDNAPAHTAQKNDGFFSRECLHIPGKLAHFMHLFRYENKEF